jgi:hypothetical protein
VVDVSRDASPPERTKSVRAAAGSAERVRAEAFRGRDFGLLAALAPVMPAPERAGTGLALDFEGKHGISTRFVQREKIPVGHYNNGDGDGCSGTLISHDLFLTNSHCIPDDASKITQGLVEFGFENGGWASEALPRRTFTVAALVEDGLTGDDYAILRLNGNPGLIYGHQVLADYEPAEGSVITIVGHPDNDPKRVDVGHVDYHLFSGSIWYDDLDTLGGSSGSGILDANGEMIGLHHNGGCDTIFVGANHGTKMIHLLDASPTLRAAPRHIIVSEPGTGVYIVNGGAKMHIGSWGEYDALGLRHEDHRVLPAGALAGLPTTPRDGTVLRSAEGAIYLVYGGARFWIPTMDEFNALGLSWADVQPAPSVALHALPLVPWHGTLLEERSSAGVYVLLWGNLYSFPSWEALLYLGYEPNRIRTVPDGSLSQIPYGGTVMP